VCEAERVKVGNAIADLAEDAIYFGTYHATRHDDTEEVIGSILHDLREDKEMLVSMKNDYTDLIVVTMITDYIDGLDNIDVL